MDYMLGPNVTTVTDDYYPGTISSPCNGELIQGDRKRVLVLLACKRLRSIMDMYLLNLALSDLFFVFSFPLQTHYQLDQWVFGTAMYKVVSGFYYIGFFSSMFFITLMSVDRYLVIVHAVYAMKVRTAHTGTVLSLAMWLTATAAASPLLVFYQAAPEDGALQCYTSYSQQTLKWKISIHFEMNIMGLLIPFSILMEGFVLNCVIPKVPSNI
ncbi:hypothetical protein MC885_012788 [Smutsia gigantea]|nr:hypothetical protein MC885_012788 [Smutsia gigantea]